MNNENANEIEKKENQDAIPIKKTSIIKSELLNNKVNYQYLFKLALIGDSGSGKTSILKSLSHGIKLVQFIKYSMKQKH